MKNAKLLNELKALGFNLFELEERVDANRVLANVVKSKELRLWEGFPVMMANAAGKGLFDYDKLKAYLKTQSEKKYLFDLVLMSLAFYEDVGLKFTWQDKLLNLMDHSGQVVFKKFLRKLKDGADVNVSGHVMSCERLKSVFTMYFKDEDSGLENLLMTKKELGLEYALSQVFSPKQKELFLKKVKGEKLSKTEKEYFSRTVKKKVSALANTELHRLALKLLE